MWLLACADPGEQDRAAYLDALKSGACEQVAHGGLRDDCWLAAAPKRAGAGCEQIGDARLADECWFLTAETTQDGAWCAKAGRFQDDCAMHAVSRRFIAGMTEDEAELAIKELGFAPDDMRPWSAWARAGLSRAKVLDLRWCLAVEDARREACEKTAVAVLNDALNRARDTQKFRCVDGAPQEPWPVRWVPSPSLDNAAAGRDDLCAPRERPQ